MDAAAVTATPLAAAGADTDAAGGEFSPLQYAQLNQWIANKEQAEQTPEPKEELTALNVPLQSSPLQVQHT